MMRIPNIFLKITVYIVALLVFSVFQGKLYANGDNTVENKEALISMAKEIAKKAKMAYYDDSDIRIVTENDFIIVKFIPKHKDVLGGGGAIYFKIVNGEYKFIKGVLWQ